MTNKKINFKVKESSEVKSIMSARFLLPILLGVVAIVTFVVLGLNKYTLELYLTDDGYAIPNGVALSALNDENNEGELSLVNFSAGESVYSVKNNSNKYLGDDKVDINDNYPLYTRSGEVLYFISDKIKLVNTEWETLDTYNGLHLSNGVTFNEDNSAADPDEIILVNTPSGHQVAQDTTISTDTTSHNIKMNTICDFKPDRVVCYEYADGAIVTYTFAIPENAIVSIGNNDYIYSEFLNQIGVTNKDSGVEAESNTTKEATDTDEETGQSKEMPAPEQVTSKSDAANTLVPEEAAKPTSSQDEWEMCTVTMGDITPWVYNIKVQVNVVDNAKILNNGVQFYAYEVDGSNVPIKLTCRNTYSTKAGESTGTISVGQLEPNKTYQLTYAYTYLNKLNQPCQYPWNYVISYKKAQFDADGKILLDASGNVLWEEVAYTDPLNSDDATKKKNDLEKAVSTDTAGNTDTHMFSEVTMISVEDIEAYKGTDYGVIGIFTTKDYSELNTIEVYKDEDFSADMEYFQNAIQIRGLRFGNDYWNNSGRATVEPTASTTGVAVPTDTAEAYINSINILYQEGTSWVNGTNNYQTTSFDSTGLMILKKGFKLKYINSLTKFSSGLDYVYKFELVDKYGHKLEFKNYKYDTAQNTYVENTAGTNLAKTSKAAPTVNIKIPQGENNANNVQFEVNFQNDSYATIGTFDDDYVSLGESLSEYKAVLFVMPADADLSVSSAIKFTGSILDSNGNEVRKFEDKYYIPISVEASAFDATKSYAKGDVVIYNNTYYKATAAVSAGAFTSSDWTETIEPKTITSNIKITSLATDEAYKVAVICGNFDINDNNTHKNVILDSSLTFVAGSLTNYGTIQYTATAKDVTHNDANINFRLVSNVDFKLYKPQLNSLVTNLVFNFTNLDYTASSNKNELSSFIMYKSEVEDIGWDYNLKDEDGINSLAYVPVHIRTGIDEDGNDIYDETTYYVEMSTSLSKSGNSYILPQFYYSESTLSDADNLWEFIISTSNYSVGNYLCFNCDKTLYTKDGTDYKATNKTLVNLDNNSNYRLTVDINASADGVKTESVVSSTSKGVKFKTLKKEPIVCYGDLKIGDTYIELVNLFIDDPDGVVLLNSTNSNLSNYYIQITNSSGVVVQKSELNTNIQTDDNGIIKTDQNANYRYYIYKYDRNGTSVKNNDGTLAYLTFIYNTDGSIKTVPIYKDNKGNEVSVNDPNVLKDSNGTAIIQGYSYVCQKTEDEVTSETYCRLQDDGSLVEYDSDGNIVDAITKNDANNNTYKVPTYYYHIYKSYSTVRLDGLKKDAKYTLEVFADSINNGSKKYSNYAMILEPEQDSETPRKKEFKAESKFSGDINLEDMYRLYDNNGTTIQHLGIVDEEDWEYDEDTDTYTLEEMIEVDPSKLYSLRTGINLSSSESSLPAYFEKVNYLEASGAQYINTGYIRKENSEYSVTFVPLSGVGWNKIFGSRKSGTATDDCMNFSYNGTDGNFGFDGLNRSGQFNYPYTVEEEYTVKITQDSLTIINSSSEETVITSFDDTTYGTGLMGFGASSIYNDYLFAENQGGTAKEFAIARISEFSIAEDGSLVRNFIPCVAVETVPATMVNTNNKAAVGTYGMYDTVTGIFYVNSNTGSFKSERDQIDADLASSTYFTSNFRQVEYIESTGTQYIDTGVIISNNVGKISIDFALGTATTVQCIVGAGDADTRGHGWGVYSVDSKFGALSPANNWYKSNKAIDTSKHSFDITINNNLTEVKENSTTIFSQTDKYWANGNTWRNMSLKICNGSYVNKYMLQGKVYSCKIYLGSTLVRDYIPAISTQTIASTKASPAKSIASGVAGLYDKVTGNFYVSSSSSVFNYHEFGAEAVESNEAVTINIYKEPTKYEDTSSNKYVGVDYIEASGSSYFDTGYTPTVNTEVEFEFLQTATGGYQAIVGSKWSGNAYLIDTQLANGKYLYWYHGQSTGVTTVNGSPAGGVPTQYDATSTDNTPDKIHYGSYAKQYSINGAPGFQWRLDRYGKSLTQSAAGIKNQTIVQTYYLNDNNITNTWTITNGYTGHASTWIYASEAFNENVQFYTDDAGTVYMNGTSYSCNSCKWKTITLKFNKGWNHLEVYFTDGTGQEGFTMNPLINNLTNSSKILYRSPEDPTGVSNPKDLMSNADFLSKWANITTDTRGNATTSLKVLGIANNDGHGAMGRLYSLKITNGTTTVRDYKPVYCYSGTNAGRYGMWDVQNNKFYPSVTSTDFTGPEVIIDTSEESASATVLAGTYSYNELANGNIFSLANTSDTTNKYYASVSITGLPKTYSISNIVLEEFNTATVKSTDLFADLYTKDESGNVTTYSFIENYSFTSDGYRISNDGYAVTNDYIKVNSDAVYYIEGLSQYDSTYYHYNNTYSDVNDRTYLSLSKAASSNYASTHYILFYNENKEYVGYTTVGAQNALFKVPSSAKYIRTYVQGVKETTDGTGSNTSAGSEFTIGFGVTVNSQTEKFSRNNSTIYKKFIPTATGKYVIYTQNIVSGDPYIFLYESSDGTTNNLTLIAEDDDSAGAHNAKITYELTGGKTYYINCSNSNKLAASTLNYDVVVNDISYTFDYSKTHLYLYQSADLDYFNIELTASLVQKQDGYKDEAGTIPNYYLDNGIAKIVLYKTKDIVKLSTDLNALDDTDWVEYKNPYSKNNLAGDTTDKTKITLGDATKDYVITVEKVDSDYGYRADLQVMRSGASSYVTVDSVYINAVATTHVIKDQDTLKAVADDPNGYYICVADVYDVDFTVCDEIFTGAIDFQGHTIGVTSENYLFKEISNDAVIKNATFIYTPTVNDSTVDTTDSEYYTPLEYIQSSGTQYINSLVNPRSSTYFRVKFTMMPTSLKNSSNYFYGGNSSGWTSFEYNGGGAYWNTGSATGQLKHSMSVNKKYTYDIQYNNGVFSVSGAYKGSFNYSGSLQNTNFCFFSANGGGAFSSERIYSFQIYTGNSNNLVRNFVPCILNTTIPDTKCANSSKTHTAGTIGMWDTVNDKFYANMGSGTFVGSNISAKYSEDNADAISKLSNKTTGTIATYTDCDTGIEGNNAVLVQNNYGTISNIIMHYAPDTIRSEYYTSADGDEYKKTNSKWYIIPADAEAGTDYTLCDPDPSEATINSLSYVDEEYVALETSAYTIEPYSAAYVLNNYGTINNFALNYENDIYVKNNVSGIALYNYGNINNGYVSGSRITNNEFGNHYAGLVHRMNYISGIKKTATGYEPITSSSEEDNSYLSYITSYNYANASVNNVYVVNNINFQSGDEKTSEFGSWTSNKPSTTLPAEYTELSYIEADGGESINLNYVPTSSTNIEVQYQSTDATRNTQTVIGSGWADNRTLLNIQTSGSRKVYYYHAPGIASIYTPSTSSIDTLTVGHYANEYSINGKPGYVWRLDRYANLGSTPTLSVFSGKTPVETRYYGDGDIYVSLNNTYSGKISTWVHATEAFSETIQLRLDDNGRVYLNSSLVKTSDNRESIAWSNYYTYTLNFQKGWNHLEITYYENTDNEGFQMNGKRFSSFTNYSKIDCISPEDPTSASDPLKPMNDSTWTSSWASFVANNDTTNTNLQTFGFSTTYTACGKIYKIIIKEGETVVRNLIPAMANETISAENCYKGTTQTTVKAGTVGLYDTVNGKFYVNYNANKSLKYALTDPQTGTDFSALITGYSEGDVSNAYVAGDLIDFKITNKTDTSSSSTKIYQLLSSKQAMLRMGPAVGATGERSNIENVSYVSLLNENNRYLTKTDFSTYAKSYMNNDNNGVKLQSLSDVIWQEEMIGGTDSNFIIDSYINISKMPTLDWPSTIDSNQIPLVDIPGTAGQAMKVISNQVRARGTIGSGENQYQAALVTLDISNSAHTDITSITISDENGTNPCILNTELLDIYQISGSLYRADLLITYDQKVLTSKLACTVTAIYDDEIVVKDTSNNTKSIELHSQKATVEVGDSIVYGQQLATPALAKARYKITKIGTTTSIADTDENYLDLNFYHSISSVNDWKSEFANTELTSDIEQNYRLSSDINFETSTTYSDWNVTRDFYGKLEGGIYDYEEITITDCLGTTVYDDVGEPRTMNNETTLTGMHTISGIGNVDKNNKYVDTRGYSSTHLSYDETSIASARFSLFTSLYGELNNIIFSNFTTMEDTDYSDSHYDITSSAAGVVAVSYSGALIDNCHVRNSTFNTRATGGALVSSAYSTTIKNCSVKNSVINANYFTDSLLSANIGGLVGYANNTSITNSYASNVTVDASNITLVNGTGGLVGSCDSTYIYSCYVGTGSVISSGNCVGGLVGKVGKTADITANSYDCKTTIDSCWTSVDVQSNNGDYVGGIAGYMGIYSGTTERDTANKLLNCYTSSTLLSLSYSSIRVNRITSFDYESMNYYYNNYAYENQNMNYKNQNSTTDYGLYQFGASDELNGASRLLTYDDINLSNTWFGDLKFDESCYSLNYNEETGKITDTYMPKLINSTTGELLYDQSNEQLAPKEVVSLEVVGLKNYHQSQSLNVTLELRSSGWDQDKLLSYGETLTEAKWNELANFKETTAIGGAIKSINTPDIAGGSDKTYVYPIKTYTSNGETALQFCTDIDYGDSTKGHYTSVYLISVPIYLNDPTITPRVTKIAYALVIVDEDNQVVKEIYDAKEWNDFFSDKYNHYSSLENIQLTGDTYNFSATNAGTPAHNIQIGKLSISALVSGKPTFTGSITYDDEDRTFIESVEEKFSGISFKNFSIDYSNNTSSVNGIFANLSGEFKNNDFENVTIKNINGGNVGIIGSATSGAQIDTITLKNINIEGINGNNVGALVGAFTGVAGDLVYADNITASNVNVNGNSYVGGLFGKTSYAEINNIDITSGKVTRVNKDIESDTYFNNNFIEVDYIESVGNSYIKTGYKHNATTHIEGEIMPLTTTSSYAGIYGSTNNDKTGGNAYMLYFDIKNSRFRYFMNGSITDVTLTAKINQYQNISFDASELAVDGKTASVNASFSGTGTDTVADGDYLLNANYGGSGAQWSTPMRLRSFTISEIQNNTLTVVRNFVPCVAKTEIAAAKVNTGVKQAKGTVGLYDTVNDIFYVSSGGNAFVSPYETTDGSTYGYDSVVLPSYFTKLEYIESTPDAYTYNVDQYIDSYYKTTSTTKIVLKAKSSGSENDNSTKATGGTSTSRGYKTGMNVILGSQSSSKKTSLNFYKNSGGTYQLYGYSSTTKWPGFNYNHNVASTYVWESPKVMRVNGVSNSYAADKDAFEVSDSTLGIFALHTSGTSYTQGAAARIYYLQIYNGTELVRNFIPAIANVTIEASHVNEERTVAEGTAGLYDTVTGKFYVTVKSDADNFNYAYAIENTNYIEAYGNYTGALTSSATNTTITGVSLVDGVTISNKKSSYNAGLIGELGASSVLSSINGIKNVYIEGTSTNGGLIAYMNASSNTTNLHKNGAYQETTYVELNVWKASELTTTPKTANDGSPLYVKSGDNFVATTDTTWDSAKNGSVIYYIENKDDSRIYFVEDPNVIPSTLGWYEKINSVYSKTAKTSADVNTTFYKQTLEAKEGELPIVVDNVSILAATANGGVFARAKQNTTYSNYQIKNIVMGLTSADAGGFASGLNSSGTFTISGSTFNNIYIYADTTTANDTSNTRYYAGVVGYLGANSTSAVAKNVTMDNIRVVGNSNGYDFGGMFGRVYNTLNVDSINLTNILATDRDTTGVPGTGGLAGSVEKGSATINNSNFQYIRVDALGNCVGGLIGCVNASSTNVNNVAIKDINILGAQYVGGVIGWANNGAKANNFTLTNAQIFNTSSYTGGFAGAVASGNYGIQGNSNANCKLTNVNIYGNGENAGGVLARASGNNDRAYVWQFHFVSGSVNCNGNAVGGIGGSLRFVNSCIVGEDLASTNAQYGKPGASSTPSVTITGGNYVGGICSYSNEKDMDANAWHSNYVYNTVISSRTGMYVGGILGYIQGINTSRYSPVKKCKVNNVTIYTTNSSMSSYGVGGLVGQIEASGIINTLSDNTVSNVIIAANTSYVGGIVGKMTAMGNACTGNKVENSVIIGNQNVGGIVGHQTAFHIDNCGITDTIVISANPGNLGGIVGTNTLQATNSNYYAQITNCYVRSSANARSWTLKDIVSGLKINDVFKNRIAYNDLLTICPNIEKYNSMIISTQNSGTDTSYRHQGLNMGGIAGSATTNKIDTCYVGSNTLILDNGLNQKAPTGYTRLNYIQSTGTQYIKTGYTPTTNTKLELDFESNTYTGSSFNPLFGTTKTSYPYRSYTASIYKDSFSLGITNSAQVDLSSGTYPYTTGRHTLIYNDAGKYTLKSTTGTIDWTYTNTGRSYGGNELHLFARNNGGNKASYKLYSCKIYEGSTLVRDFIPVQQTTGDKAYGLYDLVNNKFYANAGTGTFSAGGLGNEMVAGVVGYLGDQTIANNTIARQTFKNIVCQADIWADNIDKNSSNNIFLGGLIGHYQHYLYSTRFVSPYYYPTNDYMKVVCMDPEDFENVLLDGNLYAGTCVTRKNPLVVTSGYYWLTSDFADSMNTSNYIAEGTGTSMKVKYDTSKGTLPTAVKEWKYDKNANITSTKNALYNKSATEQYGKQTISSETCGIGRVRVTERSNIYSYLSSLTDRDYGDVTTVEDSTTNYIQAIYGDKASWWTGITPTSDNNFLFTGAIANANMKLNTWFANIWSGKESPTYVARTTSLGLTPKLATTKAAKYSDIEKMTQAVKAYATGINTLNIELDEAAPNGLTYKFVTLTDTITGTWPEGERTITLNYDYASDIELTLTLNGESSTNIFECNGFSKTIMTYDNSYWYLYNGEVIDVDGNSLNSNRTFIHMYDGMALDDDGNIYDVNTGDIVSTYNGIEKIDDVKPLWIGIVETDGEKHLIKTFLTYSLSDDVLVDNVQFYVIDGRLYSLSNNDALISGPIALAYGTKTYGSVLSEKGEIIDLGDELIYPDNFDNSNVKEISDNIDYNGKIALVRYKSGALKAFNFITGEEVSVLSTNPSTGLSLFSYFTDKIQELFPSNQKTPTTSMFTAATNYENEIESSKELKEALEKVASENVESTDGQTKVDGIEATGTGVGGLTSEEIQEQGIKTYSIDNDYVAVYDFETEETAIYATKDILSKSKDLIMSEEEKTEKLDELGITSPLKSKENKVEDTDGLKIMIVLAVAISMLIVILLYIRRKSFSDER